MLIRTSNLSQPMGFTLIELIIIMMVMTILIAIAYPNYSEFILKSRRLDAQSGLLKLAQRQAYHYAVNAAYASNLQQLGYHDSVPLLSDEEHYQLKIATATDSCKPQHCFILSASPRGDQVNDSVNLLVLHSNGIKQMQIKKSGMMRAGWSD